jgi:hypothetical protein
MKSGSQEAESIFCFCDAYTVFSHSTDIHGALRRSDMELEIKTGRPQHFKSTVSKPGASGSHL